jgi:uncharacterized protein YjbI with pentapeptide repeats
MSTQGGVFFMANQEHLDILKQSVNIWNQWREEHREEQPDLSNADLKEANLGGANLRGMNLSGANLRGANLRKVNFRGANLHMANFQGANLSGANFIEADLHFAQMRDANLSRANLRKANLHNAYLENAYIDEAKLYGVNLSRARLEGAHLLRADLRKAHLHEARLQGADLSEAILSEATLRDADLSGVNLFSVNFIDADLRGATLRNADLRQAQLCTADLRQANLSGADLRGATLNEARLNRANLRGANLSQADLTWSILSEADLSNANLAGCYVYAISAWNVYLQETIQSGLIITDSEESIVTVDNLEVAQFIYLLLNNQKVRTVIDTITSKVVLILGRFTPERKVVLDAIRDELRKRNYSPVLFDFEKPVNRDITETISTLAHMARFVIADITQAKSIPQELERVVPNLPSVPVQPLLQARAREYGLFEHFKRYPWVLEAYRYTTIDMLLKTLKEHVIDPVEQKAKELGQHATQ